MKKCYFYKLCNTCPVMRLNNHNERKYVLVILIRNSVFLSILCLQRVQYCHSEPDFGSVSQSLEKSAFSKSTDSDSVTLTTPDSDEVSAGMLTECNL